MASSTTTITITTIPTTQKYIPPHLRQDNSNATAAKINEYIIPYRDPGMYTKHAKQTFKNMQIAQQTLMQREAAIFEKICNENHQLKREASVAQNQNKFSKYPYSHSHHPSHTASHWRKKTHN